MITRAHFYRAALALAVAGAIWSFLAAGTVMLAVQQLDQVEAVLAHLLQREREVLRGGWSPEQRPPTEPEQELWELNVSRMVCLMKVEGSPEKVC